MLEWGIQFYSNKSLNPFFIRDFFKYLVSKGIDNSAGPFSIYINTPDKYLNFDDTKIKEENIIIVDDIIDIYLRCDLTRSSLSISTRYLDISFIIRIYPKENKCLIMFDTYDVNIRDEKSFLAFVNLCKETFVHFNFVYGAYRNEYQEDIPLNIGDAIMEKPKIVTLYSKLLVDRMCREKLLKAPAYKVEELENGGVMLLICTDPVGCPDDYHRVCKYLGYE